MFVCKLCVHDVLVKNIVKTCLIYAKTNANLQKFDRKNLSDIQKFVSHLAKHIFYQICSTFLSPRNSFLNSLGFTCFVL